MPVAERKGRGEDVRIRTIERIVYLQVKGLIKEWEESSPLSSGPVFRSIGKLTGGNDSQGNIRIGLALGICCVYRHLEHVLYNIYITYILHLNLSSKYFFSSFDEKIKVVYI